MLALCFTGCRTHDFPQYPPNYREYVYVTNGGSDTVTVLDVVNVRVDRELPVGHNPVAIAASPTHNEIYVVNSGAAGANGSVSVIDAEHNAVVATIPVHRQPVSIDLKSAGTLAYVANSGSNSISVLDLEARRELAQIPAGDQPVAARLAPDGKTLVVANQGGNSVTIIDASTNKPRAAFAGCPGASEVVIVPDSSKAFVPCSTGHQVMVVALAQPDAHPAQPDRLETLMDVGRAPVDLALKPDGGEIFVSNSLSDSVSEIYNTTDEVGDTYMIGNNPVRGIVSRDNSLALRSQPALAGAHRLLHRRRQAHRLRLGWRQPLGDGIFCRRAFAVCRRSTLRRRGRGAHVNAIAFHSASGRPRSQRHRRQSLQRAVSAFEPISLGRAAALCPLRERGILGGCESLPAAR